MAVHDNDLEPIASVDGTNKSLQPFGRSLETQIIANVRECTDKDFDGGVRHDAWIEKTWTTPDRNLTSRDRVARRKRKRRSAPPNISGKRHVRSSARGPGTAKTDSEHEAYIEAADGALELDDNPDNEDVLALEKYAAATVGNMTVANRTFADTRQLLPFVQKARSSTLPWSWQPFRLTRETEKVWSQRNEGTPWAKETNSRDPGHTEHTRPRGSQWRSASPMSNLPRATDCQGVPMKDSRRREKMENLKTPQWRLLGCVESATNSRRRPMSLRHIS